MISRDPHAGPRQRFGHLVALTFHRFDGSVQQRERADIRGRPETIR
jgi:hypothetical protein